MTDPARTSHDAAWFEPVAALVIFAFTLFVNRFVEWPWMWVIDLMACAGAALSYRRPILGAVLTGLSFAVLLPFPDALVSASGMAFYINIFAAVRKDLSWKVPLTLGLGGLAYISLVRKSIAEPEDRWTTSILLLIVMVLAWGGGTAFRFAARRIQRERETSRRRLQNLQLSLARELHDSVAQTLSSAAMRANIAMSDPGVSELTREQLERISEECRSSAHDLRQLLSSLRDSPERSMTPGPLADVESLKSAVNTQAERLRTEGFTVSAGVEVTKLSAARSQTLAAITLEAVNNMVKHARPGSRCTISIGTADDVVVATYTNEMDSTKGPSHGFGLTGIQERLALLDGTFHVKRLSGQWTLAVQLPLGTEGSATPEATGAATEALLPDDASV